nr:MAG TPA: tail sheath protein [Caudoviricetes sp.]DAY41437.1 MAG TPA: tail sheath protein [Caudoviricetes sp.]
MTEYVFTLTDKTPAAEIDVKETVIAQGAGQDLYDRAKKELGYTGTFEEFLATFKGERGAVGATGAKGDTGERGQDGESGKSAYEIAVLNGYVGNEEQWLASLKGRDGSPGRDGRNGLSAYELADGELLFGTVGKWLESLKGAKGDTGPKGADGRDGVGIPQKLTLSGNTLTLSDGGGSVTLPSQPATNAPAGQANEYEIHGTGMPNGKVTAPVGTTYVDTAATNGALKWIKRTGTDSRGWEVLTGDTGWRTLTIASKLGASYLKVRRKNDTVMYQFGGLSWGWFGIVRRGGPGYSIQPSDRERNVFILGLQGIPQGFRSEFSLIGGIHNDKGAPYGTWYLGGPGDGNMLRFQFTDPVPTDRDIGDIRVSSIMYLTNDPWPTSLP